VDCGALEIKGILRNIVVKDLNVCISLFLSFHKETKEDLSGKCAGVLEYLCPSDTFGRMPGLIDRKEGS
jgi:hypothetical protein